MVNPSMMNSSFLLAAILPWIASGLARGPIANASMQKGATSSVVTIPLDKQYVPVVRNEKIVSYKTAYFGKVFLGVPKQQAFTVVFDTGSGHFFLPSARCKTETCLKHSRFNTSATESAVDVDHEGRAVLPNAKV